ncbi:surfeit locus protein 1 isoform X2 [Parasteatoda tepidariorum]|uniref:surfeit locus protein 1 isoform X2 n=1 Tax=Parasteatoda tepidariorum TaxID=114398 RepID=UPI001C718DA6|nr:surfeit locus protein 1 isoform X2 [Parasteatoda tepidariorum]
MFYEDMLKSVVFKQIKCFGPQNRCFLLNKKFSTKSLTPKKIDIGRYALLAVPITTFCLGTWQVQRRKWKLNLIEEVKSKSMSPPVELPDNLEDLNNMEYQRIRVRGKFDHSREMYIGPRALITEKDEGGGLLSSRSQSGNMVITPFHVADKDLTILVNRGWVPRNKSDPSKRPEGQITKEIELVGAVRLHENRPQFSPKTQSDPNYFYFRDVNKMAAISGALPIYVDADVNSTVPGGPIGGQTRMSFRNEHLSYIITWYSLSAGTLYMWWKMYLRPLKR